MTKKLLFILILTISSIAFSQEKSIEKLIRLFSIKKPKKFLLNLSIIHLLDAEVNFYFPSN